MGNWSGVKIVSTDQYRQNRLKHMAFQLSSKKVKNVRAVVTMGIIHGIRMMIGFVLTEKDSKIGTMNMILFGSIEGICIVLAIVLLILHLRDKKKGNNKTYYSAVGNWLHGKRNRW